MSDYIYGFMLITMLIITDMVLRHKTLENRESVSNYNELVNWAIRKYPKNIEYVNGILFLVYHYRSGNYNGLAFEENGYITSFEKEDNYNPRGDVYGEDRTCKQMQKIIDNLLEDYEEDIDD